MDSAPIIVWTVSGSPSDTCAMPIAQTGIKLEAPSTGTICDEESCGWAGSDSDQKSRYNSAMLEAIMR